MKNLKKKKSEEPFSTIKGPLVQWKDSIDVKVSLFFMYPLFLRVQLIAYGDKKMENTLKTIKDE